MPTDFMAKDLMMDAKVLRDSPVLSHLRPEDLAPLLHTAQLVSLSAGDLLFAPGDLGDGVYLLLQGHVAIFLARPDGSEQVVNSLERGDLLGEDYLFSATVPGRRSAGVRALDDVQLLRFEAAVFLQWLQDHEALGRQLRARAGERLTQNLRRRSEMFEVLYRLNPPDPSQTLTFSAGQLIFRQGDTADAAYFVTSGRLTVYHEDAPQTPISELGPGDVFGEFGLIHRRPRAASVKAQTESTAIRVSSEDFASLYAQSGELREMLAGLEFVYRLPNRGVSFNFVGRQGDHNSVQRLYQLANGRRWLSSWLPQLRVFSLKALNAPAIHTSWRWAEAAQADASARERMVQLDADGQIIALVGAGTWTDLPWLLEHALDCLAVPAEVFADFERTGRLRLPRTPASQLRDETVCYCMQVSAASLRTLIAQGVDSLEGLRESTGCGAVCGGCQTTVLTLLGQSVWIPVLASQKAQTAEVRSFCLRPDMNASIAWKTGQHIAITGQVDQQWITRNYTIISAPGAGAELEIAVKREPQGQFSHWLFDGELAAKELRIAAPRGEVVWVDCERPTVCLVAGIGVTPALAIVRTAAGTERAAPVHVDYSGRRIEDMAFASELLDHAARSDALTVHIRQTTKDDRLGQSEIAALVKRFSGALFFICGPHAYIDDVVAALSLQGVLPESIKTERFVHAGLPPASRSGPTRAGFVRGAYAAALALVLAVLMLFSSQVLDTFTPPGHPNTGHEGLACAECHQTAPGTVRQRAQAQVAYWMGWRESDVVLAHQSVGNVQCNACHARTQDHHAAHLFLQARYAQIRQTLAPQRCVSCHAEHRDTRVTLSDGRYCQSCHEDMKLAQDKLKPPASPSHATLTAQARWDTCMGCHDYHGNHIRPVPVALSQAVSEADVIRYFQGGKSPYGNALRSPARQPTKQQPLFK